MSWKNNQTGSSLEQTGWKYYNQIRKKAVEQEFSWSGLFISLSIAFFIVTISASGLSAINHSIVNQGRASAINSKVKCPNDLCYDDYSNKAIKNIYIYCS